MTAHQHAQLLPKETYYDPAWFERERQELFAHQWFFACTDAAVPNPGDFHACTFLGQTLFVIRDESSNLRAFHNLCRHRGCEVLEGGGNTGKRIRCPYHRWTYALDGALRAVPNEKECFGEVARDGHALLPASVGEYRGLVFVNPDPAPKASFADWTHGLDQHPWPHRFNDGTLEYAGEATYEMHCNWKVFYENAIDGYHLGYLHDQTLGPLYPNRNRWTAAGPHVVWHSTERPKQPHPSPTLISDYQHERNAAPIPGHNTEATHPGIVMLFPSTALALDPWGFSVSVIEPVAPETTLLRAQMWAPPGTRHRYRDQAPNAPIRLADLEVHPLKSGDFQIEDMWIVEKIQRNLHSPHFQVGPLAQGPGAETPLVGFQQQVLDILASDD